MNTKLNKSDWIVIIIVYTVSITFNSIDYYKEGNMLREYFVDFSVSTIVSLSGVLLFIYWLIPNFLVRKQNYIFFCFLGLIILFTTGVIDYTAGYWSAGKDWNKFPKGLDFVLRCIFRTTDDLGLILGILLTKKFYEGQTQFLKVEKQQKENELKLLRSQIDPHFLFNNLNTLDSLIDTDSEKAKEYINRLSLIYRYLIQTKDSEVMELSKEIQFAENYIFLMKTRFEDDYEFHIVKNNAICDFFIPTGALQTLLENVVKHNKPDGVKAIQASITINNDQLTVVNTKSSFKVKSDSLATGLNNLKTRYKLLSDKEISIINTDKNFKVTIPIIKLSE